MVTRLPRDVLMLIMSEMDESEFLEIFLLNRYFYKLSRETLKYRLNKKYKHNPYLKTAKLLTYFPETEISDDREFLAKVLPHLRNIRVVKDILQKFYHHGIPIITSYEYWEEFFIFLIRIDPELYQEVEDICPQVFSDNFYMSQLINSDFYTLSKVKHPSFRDKVLRRNFNMRIKRLVFFWNYFKTELWKHPMFIIFMVVIGISLIYS